MVLVLRRGASWYKRVQLRVQEDSSHRASPRGLVLGARCLPWQSDSTRSMLLSAAASSDVLLPCVVIVRRAVVSEGKDPHEVLAKTHSDPPSSAAFLHHHLPFTMTITSLQLTALAAQHAHSSPSILVHVLCDLRA